WGEVGRLIEEGKVRHGGLSNHPAEAVERALAVGPVAALQYQYSLLHREPELEILPLARERGLGLITWSPLAAGFVGDGFGVAPARRRRAARNRDGSALSTSAAPTSASTSASSQYHPNDTGSSRTRTSTTAREASQTACRLRRSFSATAAPAPTATDACSRRS